METGKFSDAKICIGEKEFNVHRTILAARSPVFAAMFEHDCEENRQNMVRISDIDADVFQDLLRYTYSAKIPSLDKYPSELFIAADKVCVWS